MSIPVPEFAAPFSADDLCLPIHAHLEQHLASRLASDLEAPYLWRQLPEEDQMDTAAYPAVSVSTSGTIGAWRKTRNSVDATWRVVVAFWVEDFGYNETTSAVRRYVAAGRNCLLAANRSDWRITGEDYSRLVDPALSKTLGAGRVYLEVDATAANLDDLTVIPGAPLRIVTAHTTTVIPKE